MHRSILQLLRMELGELNKFIKELVLYAIKAGLCTEEDFTYAVNQLLSIFKLDEYEDVEVSEIDTLDVMRYINPLLKEAVNKKLIDDTVSSKDALEAKIMDVFLPMPSMVSKVFNELYEKEISSSTDYLYNLAVKSNYIKTKRVQKNVTWKSSSKYGDIDMTINVSKPEKTVAEIKRAKLSTSKYPKCLLCLENVGFEGTDSKPARNNLRAVPITVNNEDFYLQYSPYVYYNEHSICFKKTHEAMVINDDTFSRLLDFVEQFPHYFLGSNADLPIVGGSILSHEHYQGGRYEFPLQRADVLSSEVINGVKVSRLFWPLTVIQLEGEKEDVKKLASLILRVWKNYTDEDAGVIAKTDAPHNTITPIARMKDGLFQLDLALRNNRTSTKYPDGIFHSHPEHHHIKRENLGLIEVMGLSVLPGRLVQELEDVKKFVRGSDLDVGLHTEWASTLKNVNELDEYLKQEVTNKFVACLENAGVFKNDSSGEIYYNKFLKEVKNA